MLLRHFRNPFLESPASSFGDFRIKRNKKIKKTPIHWADGNKQCIFSRFFISLQPFQCQQQIQEHLPPPLHRKSYLESRCY
jgi:hypothetical protein